MTFYEARNVVEGYVMNKENWDSTIAFAIMQDGTRKLLRGNRGGIILAARHIGAVSVLISQSETETEEVRLE
jgi:hypothetical protein